jgi:hypothetical protein
MKRTWTIIGVADVALSFKWYQSLFGQPETLPEHDYFGQIRDTDGTVLLCLHRWGAHEHPHWLVPIIRNLATDYSCSFAWMILTRRWLGPVLSSPDSKRSLI